MVNGCWGELSATGGTLCTEAGVLGAEWEWLGSEMGWRVAFRRIAFGLISFSFLVRGLKPQQIWHFSPPCHSPRHFKKIGMQVAHGHLLATGSTGFEAQEPGLICPMTTGTDALLPIHTLLYMTAIELYPLRLLNKLVRLNNQ